MSKSIYDEFLAAKPIGIFCFKNEIKEFMGEAGLRQLVRLIDDLVDTHSAPLGFTFTPHFHFDIHAEKVIITISRSQPHGKPNLEVTDVALQIVDYGKHSTRFILGAEEAMQNSSKKPLFKRASYRARRCL